MSNGGRPPNGRTNLVNLGGHGGQNVKKEDALPTGGHVASLYHSGNFQGTPTKSV